MTENYRQKMIDQLGGAVLNDRRNNYGSPENNFANIAAYWSTWLQQRHLLDSDTFLDPVDVASMMSLLKIARLSNSPDHEDSWTDLAGYGICGGEIADAARDRMAKTRAGIQAQFSDAHGEKAA